MSLKARTCKSDLSAGAPEQPPVFAWLLLPGRNGSVLSLLKRRDGAQDLAESVGQVRGWKLRLFCPMGDSRRCRSRTP